jgi:hypothetical protein
MRVIHKPCEKNYDIVITKKEFKLVGDYMVIESFDKENNHYTLRVALKGESLDEELGDFFKN